MANYLAPAMASSKFYSSPTEGIEPWRLHHLS
jgi:hypothetical protein